MDQHKPMIEIFTLYLYKIAFKFDTITMITMILDKRVKSQGVSEEEQDFIIGAPLK